MTDPEVLVLGGLRLHLLIPHDVVGAIQDDKPTWQGSPGLTIDGNRARTILSRRGKPILEIGRASSAVHLTALAEIWIQEPGLTVKMRAGGLWRGFGPKGKWTKTTAGIDGWLPMNLRDAHRATVHHSHVKTNPDYTVGAEYRKDGERWRFSSDVGFSRLLARLPAPSYSAEGIPWQGCSVSDHDTRIVGTWAPPQSSRRPLRRLELAGHPAGRWPGDWTATYPASDWFHFVGWGGGAAGVVDEHGREVGYPGDNHLCVYVWKRLLPGQTISQTITVQRLH